MRRLAISIVFTAAVLAFLFMRLDVRDGVYAMPVANVNEVIDRTDLPMMIFADRAMSAKHWRADASTSVWAVLGHGDVEILRLHATTVAEGEGVRVHIEALPPPGELHDQVAQGIKQNGSNIDLMTTALAEQIDANLNGREFDLKRISPAIGRVVLLALPHLRENADKAAKQAEQREQDNVDRAYANEK